jgi:outer membrane cobalamin receptor
VRIRCRRLALTVGLVAVTLAAQRISAADPPGADPAGKGAGTGESGNRIDSVPLELTGENGGEARIDSVLTQSDGKIEAKKGIESGLFEARWERDWEKVDSIPYAPVPPFTYLPGELVETPSRSPEPIRSVPMSVAVLSADEITESGSDLLGEVLEGMAGSNVAYYGWVGQPEWSGLRGSSSRQVLFLLDGRPLTDPRTGEFDLSQAATNGLATVEMELEGASSLYGPNSVGGVVNLVPKVFEGEVPYTKVTLERGTYNTSFSQLEYGMRVAEATDMYLTGEYRKTDGYRKNGESSGRSTAAQVRHHISDSLSLALGLRRFNGDRELPGPLTSPTPAAEEGSNRLDVDLTLRGDVARIGATQATAYMSDLWRRLEGDGSGAVSEAHRIWGGIVQQTLPAGGAHRLTLGAEGEQVEALPDGGDEERTRRGALYARAKLRPARRASLLAGARYDYHSEYGSAISPSLNIGYEFHPGLVAFAGYGHSFAAPTLAELDPARGGNPDLGPEQADAFEMGVRETGLAAVDVQVAGFVRRTSDEIVWAADDSTDPAPRNARRTEAVGVEASVRGDLGAGVSCRGAYTYADVRDRDTERVLPYRPRHTLSGHVEYVRSFRYDRVHLTLRLGGTYLGERYADTEESVPVGEVGLLDARATLRIIDVWLYYEIRNLLSADYEYILDYPMPKRTTSIGIAWQFWD